MESKSSSRDVVAHSCCRSVEAGFCCILYVISECEWLEPTRAKDSSVSCKMLIACFCGCIDAPSVM